MIGYLNTSGGDLVFGITDSGVKKGTKITQNELQ